MIKKIIFLQIIFSTVLFAQDNVTLLSNLDEHHSDRYSDIWGYVDPMGNEYALLQVRTGTSVIDLSDPTNPYEISFIPGPDTRARDIKVHSEYAYVVSDYNGVGLQIIDLSNLPDSAFLVKQVNTWFNEAHNLFIDDGFAYIVGTDEPGSGMHILDLSDPINPIRTVYYGGSGGIHDVYVWDDTVVLCNGWEGEFQLLDVTDKTDPKLVSTYFPLPGVYAHSGWMTEDKRYFYGTDEHNITDVTVFDLQDRLTWDVTLMSWQTTNTQAVAHNLFIRGNYAHLSYYKDGYVVLDISDPEAPVLAGQYVTFDMWGCYPFLPSGITICSDIFFGLYVFSFDGNLPVELSSFVANNFGDAVALYWTTETETNNFGFEIQRKSEGDFVAIGFVEGHGNSNSPKKYKYIDDELNFVGNYYYRLKQIDNDGTFKYSDVLEIEVVLTEFELKQNYPNPFNPETRIDYTLPEKQLVSLRIYNSLGESVRELVNEVKEAGSYSVTFNASKLSSGIYIYRIQTENFTVNKKMTFLK